jgi:hypothetical protein
MENAVKILDEEEARIKKELNEKLGELFSKLCGIAWGTLKNVYWFIAHGYVLTILWSWFISERFGLELLSIPAAVGLMVIGRVLTRGHSTPGALYLVWQEQEVQTKNIPKQWKVVKDIALLISPWVFLLVGWIAFKFM